MVLIHWWIAVAVVLPVSAKTLPGFVEVGRGRCASAQDGPLTRASYLRTCAKSLDECAAKCGIKCVGFTAWSPEDGPEPDDHDAWHRVTPLSPSWVAGCFASKEFVCELHHISVTVAVGADGSLDYDNPGSVLVSGGQRAGATCYAATRARSGHPLTFQLSELQRSKPFLSSHDWPAKAPVFTPGRRRPVLAIGGFGGSGTRAWTSIFKLLGLEVAADPARNPTLDSLVRMPNKLVAGIRGKYQHLFPPCKASWEEYLDNSVLDQHHAGMRRRRKGERHSIRSQAKRELRKAVRDMADVYGIALKGKTPWAFKQPAALLEFPLLSDLQEFVLLLVTRDPRDLVVRRARHAMPDGTELMTRDMFCPRYGLERCNWHARNREHKPDLSGPLTPLCQQRLLQSWAVVNSAVLKRCLRAKKGRQRFFVGRSEDLLDKRKWKQVTRMLQHVLGALGVTRDSASVSRALRKNAYALLKHRPSSYGRWRNFSFAPVNGDTTAVDRMPHHVEMAMDNFGYE